MKIVIWTGSAWETWGSRSILEGGIGGSETAAIKMAMYLTTLGHEVSIIGQVIPGQADGVEYIDHRRYLSGDATIQCDVFISSRELLAFRKLSPRCRLSVLWMHDIHVGDDWSEAMLGYDVVFCLSEWARRTAMSYYPYVPRSKFVVTRNGIEPALYLRPGESLEAIEPVSKEGCNVVYSSSPDRGLSLLLDFWPAVREICPGAELHVYYGFNTWRRLAQLKGNQAALMTIDFMASRLTKMQDNGVVNHGRVGQAELAQAFMESRLWLYPTNFLETSCITAMEAQAAGSHVVASKLGALIETVRCGHLIEAETGTYDSEFLKAVELAIEDKEDQRRLVSQGREWTLRNLSWSDVANSWSKMFEELLSR